MSDDVKITIESQNPLAVELLGAVVRDALREKNFTQVVTLGDDGQEKKISHTDSLYDMVNRYAPHLFAAKVAVQYGVQSEQKTDNPTEEFDQGLESRIEEAVRHAHMPRPSLSKMCAPSKEEIQRALAMAVKAKEARDAERSVRQAEEERIAKKTSAAIRMIMSTHF